MNPRSYPATPAKRVAFLGLGVMGHPMAGHLARAGHQVTVYNRTTSKSIAWCEEFTLGSRPKHAETPRQAAHGADIVALSALLTTTMVQMKSVVDALRAAGLATPVIIGGAPVTHDFAKKIAASGYAPDAASGVEEVRRMIAD